MSYRRKKLLALFCAATLTATACTGCGGTTDSTEKIVSTETEISEKNENSAQSVTEQLSYEDMFTERDLSGTYEESEAVYVTLSDDGISAVEGSDNTTSEAASESNETSEADYDDNTTSETNSEDNAQSEAAGIIIENQTVTITEEGTYIFSGTLSEGQIVVDAEDAKVQIVFDNVNITCATSAAVYVKSADKVFVTLAEGSQNKLCNTEEYAAIDDNNIDAVIFSKSDLTLNGSGSLTIEAANGHGIVSKDDLKITGGTYEITAEGHALSGKDSVRIADGSFTLTSGKDGIHAENEDNEEKGYIYIADGNFTIKSDGDGIDASNIVQIEDGTFDITAGGGAANSTKTHEQDMPGGPGGGRMPQGEKPDSDSMPEMGEKPDGDSMPKMGEKPDGDSMPEMGEKPDDENMPEMGERPDGGTPPEKPTQDLSDSSTDSKENGTDSKDSGTDTTEETGTVTAENDNSATDESSISTKGIKADNSMFLNGGTFQIDSADDSIHSNANITIEAGNYTLSTGDDGVHADDALVVNGGTITVAESYEGLEGLTVTINDGTIDITSSDDGINAAGGDNINVNINMTGDSNNDTWMELNGGYIHILAGGDGVDSNGDLTINGGEIYIDGPSDNGNSAIDYGDWSSAYVNGGTLVAIGSSGMAEEMSEASKQEVLMVKLDSQMEAGDVVLTDSDGNVIVSYTASKSYDCVIISTADLESGAVYTLTTSGTSTEVTAE